MARGSGLLLHPTTLPGPYGIGDLGAAAYEFVDFLVAAGQSSWQILPLGPTGYGDSPYQTFSAFAGNPVLVSPRGLVDDGFLPTAALADAPAFPAERVDYGQVLPYKRRLLARAFAHYQQEASPDLRRAVDDFAAAQRSWIAPFALFMALKEAHDLQAWTAWEPGIAAHEPEAVRRWSERLAEAVQGHIYSQYLFFHQWDRLKAYAGGKGIRIIGDAPIFVAHDSADCWARRELFYLTPDGQPMFVAGVPPDYFAATGQRWGNPLYRWDAMAADGYAWWIERLRAALSVVDVLRLDHFRGFAGYWAIPGDAPTAETGTWEPGPGIPFFTAVEAALGRLPIIAEDLGVITPDVVALRDHFGLPGMKVLQFAFDAFESAPDNPHLPHNYGRNAVVYTGTHDNDTTAGWYATASPHEQEYARAYAACAGTDPAAVVRGLVRVAQASVAETAVIPLQDLLALGSEARMNRPGQPGGNWQWRYTAGMLTDALAAEMAALGHLYGRARTG